MKIRINKLDAVFSQYLRLKYPRCQIGIKCTNGQSTQVSHFVGRANQTLRYDEDNVTACCFACHQYMDANPMEHVLWKRYQLDDRFDILIVRSRGITKRTKQDKEDMIKYYQDRIKELG